MPQKILLYRLPPEKWPKVTHSVGRRAKKREGIEGFALGLFFGPFGVLIEALLPTGTAPAPVAPAPAPVLVQAAEEARAARAARWAKEAEEERERARERAREEEAERWCRDLEAKARRAAWYRERGVEPGPLAWFKVWPDWLQMIVAGLLVSAPIVAAMAFLLGRR
jgi:hypothetical protein